VPSLIFCTIAVFSKVKVISLTSRQSPSR
jgi:hypothetical protein